MNVLSQKFVSRWSSDYNASFWQAWKDQRLRGSTSSSLLDDKTGLWNGVGLVGGVTLYLRSGGIIKQEVKEFPQLELEESMDELRTERTKRAVQLETEQLKHSSYPLLSFTICCWVSDGNITGLNTIDVADVLH
ncbi:Protein mini spindles [Frankliniella fusca]|uniref:Protein mini spindles n=1 Tax=Frankliniella fusca TaxID=407009 RepID=A0AAE1HJ56_9NEOP|nr:Protein mini spindles [Frankliniella fusca]